MRNLMIVLLMAISVMYVAQTNAQECTKEAWVKEEAPTQGGGFFWIPGKESDVDREKATLLAKAEALIAYTRKCGVTVPDRVTFHEICTKEPGFLDGGVYTVYVRLSYTRADCAFSREYENPKYTPAERRRLTSNELMAIGKTVVANGW